MDSRDETALANDIAGALDWWRDAGVDYAFHTEPARWISPAQPTARAAERQRAELREAPPEFQPGRAGAEQGQTDLAPASRARSDSSGWPRDLALFAEWWLTEPWLDNGRTGGRIAPRGNKGAALMVIVPEPESGDRDRLLAGTQGRLLDAILAALGVADDQVYVASALPRHMPMPDWQELGSTGFGGLLAHHVSLVAPRRVIAFGEGILSLLRNTPAISSAEPLFLEHDQARTPLLVARSLEGVLARPAWKAELWRTLLDWAG